MNEEINYVIDVTNLTKYFGSKCVVDSISLTAKKGEILGFLGPNGSGKTTTIRMLCGLLTADRGTGTCLGYDIMSQTNEIKRNVGYMTQKFSLYDDLSVKENLTFISRAYQIPKAKQVVKNALDKNGFSKQRQKQLAGELSGGWKQRLALTSAMLHEPKLLLLDEPTAGVDPKARRDFWDHIHNLSEEGITTLVSTHYMDEAERCHRLAYISHGTLLSMGTIFEIIDSVKLHTWRVSGEHLTKLATELKKQHAIEQVIVFGRTLHILGKDPTSLEQAIEPFRQLPNYDWRKSLVSLEDVFIYLVGETKEES